VTISEPCDDGAANGTADNPVDRSTAVRFLNSVTLPDGSAWAMEYRGITRSSTTNLIVCDEGAGHLTKITLPTGGHIDYTIGKRAFPIRKEEFTGFGSLAEQKPIYHSAAVTARTLVDRTGASSTWNYSSVLRNQGPYQVPTQTGGTATAYSYQTLVVVITNPLGEKTAHYFSASKIFGSNCVPGGRENEYGLPFTHAAASSIGNFLLSSETFAAGCTTPFPNTSDDVYRCNPSACTPLRREYVQYEMDTTTLPVRNANENTSDQNRRPKASRTVFLDDPNCGPAADTPCYVESVSSDFDGLGHYRTTTTNNSFPNGVSRSSSTHFNASSLTYTPNVNSAGSSFVIAPSANWLLNRYDYRDTTQGSSTSRAEACFNDTTGFLERTRTLTSGVSEGTSDVLVAYDNDGHGNVSRERYMGGDRDPLTANFATCSGTLPAARYDIQHVWDRGAVILSSYANSGFNTLDIVRDSNTSLPITSRDSATLATGYVYDTSGRLTEVHPPSSAWTQYLYTTSPSVAKVKVLQWPFAAPATGSALTEQQFDFDGIGRLSRTSVRMPDGNWSVTQTLYDALARKSQVSEPKSFVSPPSAQFVADASTTTSYDILGRPISVTGPDGSVATVGYVGSRLVSRSSCIATGTGSPDCAGAGETLSTTTETYDAFGQLASVLEPGANSATTYGYDESGRLRSVDMTSGSVTQPRRFTYDGRGFLSQETHPEKGITGNGAVLYQNYDARGHAWRKIDGAQNSAIDLSFVYDGAERLTAVNETVGSASIKSFVFGSANAPGNWVLGRLQSSSRVNRTTSATGTAVDIVVTDTLTYDDAGRLSSKSTAVQNGTAPLQTFTQSMQYDALGSPATIGYPACAGTACAGIPANSNVTNTWSRGRLTGINGFGTINYHPNGLVSNVQHQAANGANSAGSDVQTVVDNSGRMLPRPSAITFTGVTTCASPATPVITADANSVCASASSSAHVSAEAGATYQWSITGGTITSGATTATVTYTVGTSGQATLNVAATNSCGTTAALPATIAIETPPSIAQQPASTTIVSGSTAQLQVTAVGGTFTYQWFRGVTGNSADPIAGATAATYTASPSTTTSYWVRVSGTGCTTNSTTATVTVTAPLPGPTGLRATTQANTSVVVIQWNAVSGATQYQVRRRTTMNGTATLVGSPTTQTSITDTVPASSTAIAYIYVVNAINANGESPNASNADFAVTATSLFTDEPLHALNDPSGPSFARGAHILELRRAIDALRTAVSLGLVWPGATAPTGFMAATDVTSLKTALDPALQVFGYAPFAWTGTPSPASGGFSYGASIQQLRDALR
jgi:YD repeat-containing protein